MMQLRTQFFLESTLLAGFSIMMAFIIAYLFLPQFNHLLDKKISFQTTMNSPEFVFVTGALAFLILIFAGFVPAFYFTRQRKQVNLNQFFIKEKINSPGRNALVIIQFSVALILIIGTLTIYNQLQLINNGYLGQSRETVIGVRTSRMGDSLQIQRYKTMIQGIPGVESNTLGMHLPRQSDFGRINTRYFVPEMGDEPLYWNKFDADGGFLKSYDLNLLAGRDFRSNIEYNGLIINETAARALGRSPSEAIGLYLREDSINYVYLASHGPVIGVVEDFVYKSIKEPIEPLVICANNYVEGVLSVRLGEGNKQEIISELENIWSDIYPGRPFEYWYLENEFNRMYNQERRLGKLVPLFSGLAILVALLGLYALTVFIADLRQKEIGIRKVLGCSTSGILQLLTWHYLKTLIPAVLIAVPLAIVGLNYWLDHFIYRVDITFGMVAISVSSTLLFALCTIGFKSFRTATLNPVDSLKYE